MRKLLSRRSGAGAVFATSLAALIIGCGGGGGGGGGTSSTGTTATTATPTTSTTSTTATTATPTTSTTATTANPTTATTATGATGGVSIGGDASSGSPGSGLLVPNSIYFAQFGSDGQTFDIKYTTEPASGAAPVAPTTYAAGLSSNSPAATPDPSAAGQIFFTYAPSAGQVGIYRGTNPSTNVGAQTIVSSQYSALTTLQVTRDGKRIVYVAQPAGETSYHLYYAVVGSTASTPVRLDNGDVVSADVNQNGNQIVYSRVDTNGTNLYVNAFSPSGSQLLIGGAGDRSDPQYSKGGPSRVIYARGASQGERHVIEFITPAGTTAQIDPFPNTEVGVRAPTYNSDGTRIAFVADDPNGATAGVYTIGVLGDDLRKVVDGNVLTALYWTTALGRGAGNVPLHLNLPRPK